MIMKMRVSAGTRALVFLLLGSSHTLFNFAHVESLTVHVGSRMSTSLGTHRTTTAGDNRWKRPFIGGSSRHPLTPSPALLFSTTNTNKYAINDGGDNTNNPAAMSKLSSSLTKMGMMLFLTGMCASLTVTLLPQRLLFKLGLIDRMRKERWALSTGQWCARTMLRLFPFINLHVSGFKQQQQQQDQKTTSASSTTKEELPPPCIWVCNHTSMLDVFILLATDRQLRGRNKRPIKIVYWKGLEANPFTRLLFTQSGFISVEMADNGNGTANEYDKSTFKRFLKDCKQAFNEGFDVGLLPEGQLNPFPERGLLPIFSGAYTLAKLSRRPIGLLALHGLHRLWHPEYGMTVTGRDVYVRAYPNPRTYTSADEFMDTFRAVIGEFGRSGRDLPADKWPTDEKDDKGSSSSSKPDSESLEAK